MFSVRFVHINSQFRACVSWGDGTSESTRAYNLQPVSNALNFDKTIDFDSENTRNPRVDEERVAPTTLEQAGRLTELLWARCNESEQLGLLAFLADIFVAGTSVVKR